MSSFPFVPFPIPEEMRAQMEEHHNRTMMEMADARHQIAALFNEMSKEHLFALRMVLSGLANAETKSEAKQLASYYEGIAAAKLEHRFGVCPGCGLSHEEELFGSEKTAEADGVEKEGIEVLADGVMRQSLLMEGEAVQPSLFVDPDPREAPAELQPGDLERMEEYNLDDVRDEDTLKLLGFICKGCGLRYQSIEDRMRREAGAEGCNGCIQKAKWG